jgi:hypothetical protein
MPDNETPVTGNGTNGETPATGTGATPTPEEIESLRAALKAANKESADRRKRLEALEADEAKRKEAELSEVEKADQRAKAAEAKAQGLEQRWRDGMLRSAVTVEASKLQFYDPEDAFRLADLTALTVNEDGTVTGVEDALKALVKAKPHLVKTTTTTPPPDVNAQNRGRTATPTTDELVAAKLRSGNYVPI